MSIHVLDIEAARRRWYPIASSTDLVPRHVFHAQLLGREFAVWRADDNHVNVWENRCLHRGVRLSIGINDGRELACQYHGWRYANRTAGCTYIPAHPADAPARTVCNNTYPALERAGLIWSGEEPVGEPPLWFADDLNPLVLRPIPVNAPSAVVASHLSAYVYDQPDLDRQVTRECRESEPGCFVAEPDASDESQIVFYLQPVDSTRTVIRGVVSAVVEPLAWLKSHNRSLSQLRKTIEALVDPATLPDPIDVNIVPVAVALSRMPEKVSTGRSAALRVQVDSLQQHGADVVVLELMSIDEQLPTFQPGAHIDVHLANGLIRQYSLVNAPGQTDRYIVAIKREAESTGGSAFIHDSLRVGDVLAISAPRNNFPLRRDAVDTLLIAGGIGITPMLSMAQALHHAQFPWQLHYFIQSESARIFPELLASLGDKVTVHVGLSPEETSKKLQGLFATYANSRHAYLCGPPPMLSAARSIATRLGWPDESVHFEYFSNTTQPTTEGSFTVSLARSGLTLDVPAGKSLLSVLRENGVDLPSSCEQGACGTCKVSVLKGLPLHQDVYLNKAEQTQNDCMMTCVSRAVSESLTLDI